MVNVRRFQSQIKSVIAAKVDEATFDKMKLIAERTYETIFLNWPADTFWSMANHRISITGRPIIRLQPATRPTQKGALIDKQESTRQSELAKLRGAKPARGGTRRRVIFIGNSVPYARNVGFKNGLGVTIYRNAAAEGARQAQAISRTRGK